MLHGKTFFVTGGLGLICSTVIDVLLTCGKTGKIYVGARNIEQFKDRFGNLIMLTMLLMMHYKNQIWK